MGAMLLARGASGADDDGPVFSARNESGEAWTINVAGFPIVAVARKSGGWANEVLSIEISASVTRTTPSRFI